MRAPRVDTQQVDLDAFESWLRGQLAGPAFAAVVSVVLQMIRALFTQNAQLRMRLQGRRPKPPSERFEVLDRQLAFAFAVPTNDVAPAAPTSPTGDAPTGEPEMKPRAKPTPRGPIPKGLPIVDVPNDVPASQRDCVSCCAPMTTVRYRPVSTIEMIPGRIVVHRRLDEILACPHCDAMVCAKAPPSILDGGRLGPTLVTEALCSKVLDGMPVERQAFSGAQSVTHLAAMA